MRQLLSLFEDIQTDSPIAESDEDHWRKFFTPLEGVRDDRPYVVRETTTEEGRRRYLVLVNAHVVASATLSSDGSHVTDVSVLPDFQKRGIATALYHHIEALTGRTLKPSPTYQSKAGKALWSARSRINGGPARLSEGVAWHGSAQKFDAFEIEKIGSGEGADAYGWGLYLTDTQDVAAYYRRKLSEIHLDGRPLASFGETTQEAVMALHDNGWDKDETVEQRPDLADKIDGLNQERVKFNGGYIYEVEIPDDASFLLWDAPFKSQSPNVKKALRQMIPNVGTYFKNCIKDNDPGETFYKCVGKYIRNTLHVDFDSYKKESSLIFLRAGIVGIKYLDGNSRGETNGSYNYVIFDHSLIKVVGRHE